MSGSPDAVTTSGSGAAPSTGAAAAAFREALAHARPAAGDPSIATLLNLRDLGGWRTAGGRTVRRGVLYRSAAPDRLDDTGLRDLAALRIRTVIDLRTGAERIAAPDRVPDGAVVVALDVLADETRAVPAHLAELFADPATIGEHLGDGRAEALFVAAYRSFVTLPSARASYRALFTRLADDHGLPALVHCTTGKDRTGWGVAALLTWLGVSESDVLAEYLRTNELLLPALQPVFQRFAAVGADTEILEAVLGVRQAYLEAALEEMHALFGSVQGYVTDGLGLDQDVQAAVRATLLD